MKAELLGFDIDAISFDEAIIKALSLIENNVVSQVVTINPEIIESAIKSGSQSDLYQAIKNAELVIPDGVGIQIALRLNGVNTERIPGIDFAKKLLALASKNSIPVAIIGSKEEVINKAIDNLKAEFKELNIVYSHNGYFNDDTEIYDALKAAKPGIILVATGSPKQELFIYNAKNILDNGLMIGIGGSLDVWSGMVKRAPKIYQTIGMEWFYRTITQPERFKRIFPTLPLFILKAIKHKYLK